MRRFLFSLLLVSCGALAADELVEANRLLQAKDYGKAMAMFTRLADAGNPDAQLRLGEMYWFGEGTGEDLDAARRWFEKSAAAGNVGAKESLAVLDRRKTRGAEIVYWTQQYDGADLRSGQFACPLPEIPDASRTNEEIKATKDAIDNWRSCQQGFMANFNATVSSGKHIPSEVLGMMTPSEVSRAQAQVQAVYARVKAQAIADIDTIASKQLEWHNATDAFVKNENLRLAKRADEEKRMYIEQQRRQNDERRLKMDRAPSVRPAPPVVPPTRR
jgi:hypothetical protein